MAAPVRTLADDAPHLLVVDDDRRIRDLLSRFLVERRLSRHHRRTAPPRRAPSSTSLSFDLLILDVMMPGETGFEFASRCAQTSSVPILMLTARDAAESRITGLEIGADDYLSKPFEPRELSLRIANILKRAQPARRAAGRDRCASGRSCFIIGARRTAPRRRGRPPHRPRARDAARARRDARARPCRAWRSPATAARSNERAVDVQVNRLRRKIERDPANPLFVQTVRGIGYRLVVVAMTTPRHSACARACARLRVGAPVARLRRLAAASTRWLNGMMPKGLYARALLIIIAPMVILQSVVAFVFMERHWNR